MSTLTRDKHYDSSLGTFKASQYHKNAVEEKYNSIYAVIKSTQYSTNTTEVTKNKKEFTVKNLTDILQLITTLLVLVTSNKSLSCNFPQESILQSDIDFKISNFFDFILEKINSEVSELLQADRATIFIYDEDKKQLWSKVAQSSDKYESLEIRIPINEGIAGSVAKTGKILNVPDTYNHPEFNPHVDAKIGYTTKNLICVPFFNSKKKNIGVIQVLNKHQGKYPFKDEDEKTVGMLAESLGSFMEVLEFTLNETYQQLINQKESYQTINDETFWITEIDKGDRLPTISNLNDFW